ncbi:prolyl oligopeptidase family serine peptidase [Novosphingobium sp.]|uniref:prolyl oligopeptidase family serine peptidase n=1 Tax=Novosphingobium sp. TaxID=1874826 RepID=UPI001D61A747|nr:prolyl oligopeptidase family serine peptidase [Novosphingobium sp.]MBX9665510.1 prolyl oligopeptidase family serine peptidase [Novosphingobium sp.]
MRRLALVAALALSANAYPAQAQAVAETADPYIWLEDIYSPRAMAWVEAENARSLAVLKADPQFAGFYADALKIAEATDRIAMPRQIGGQIANLWQDGTHVHGLWRITSPAEYEKAEPAWQTLLDLDALSAAEKANWVWAGADCEPTAERRCLVALSDGGEDANIQREFDLATRSFVSGGFTLPKSKQWVSWETPDSLIAARDWGAGTMTASGYPFVVKRVKRGAPLEAASEVFRGKPDDVFVIPRTFTDGAGHSEVVIMRGITFFEAEFVRVTPQGTTPIAVPRKSTVTGLTQGRLIFQVNEDWTPAGGQPISAGSLVAVDPAGKAAPEVIFAPGPRQSVDADEVAVTQGHVLAAVYDNVRGRAMRFTRTASGWQQSVLPLPDNAAISMVSSDRASNTAYVSVQSYLLPTALWKVDAAAGTAIQIKQTPARFAADGLVTEQFMATSKDGTKVPYFITHRADMPLTGTTPTLMTAYGGFQISYTPAYSGVTGKLWLERGGAYVVANIRGGGEFGPAWHEAGLKTKRQVIYDDFAAVAEDLMARKITSPQKLGIYGGSNGGLLMGVELIQRPELFGAVSIQIPLLDMLRYEKLSAGASWVGEYGTMANPDEKAFWLKTSPYSNLKPGAPYPETLIWTTTKDDRVGPVQARKFAARMKEYGLPYLYYESTAGGHGAGANLKEKAMTIALEMVYFQRRLMDTK